MVVNLFCTKFRNTSHILALVVCVIVFLNQKVMAQGPDMVAAISHVSGFETNNALFKVTSKTIPELAYIRAQRVKGPQNGIFSLKEDNIRYTSLSKADGVPGNLSVIRFTFLKSDKRTLIEPRDFRFIINDIDGPNNEALGTDCDNNLRFLGTANPTNLSVLNLPPSIVVVGEVGESEGATSRVMFEFKHVSVIELDNYANMGYFKDFDMNNQYPIDKPTLVTCGSFNRRIYTPNGQPDVKGKIKFVEVGDKLLINTKPIYFDNDKFNIRPDAESELEMVLEVFNTYENIIVKIYSYTDSRAENKYNLILSEARAQSTINWFIERGVDPSRISGEGHGESQLVNECSDGVDCTEEQHQRNRRTEFVIVNPEVITR